MVSYKEWSDKDLRGEIKWLENYIKADQKEVALLKKGLMAEAMRVEKEWQGKLACMAEHQRDICIIQKELGRRKIVGWKRVKKGKK